MCFIANEYLLSYIKKQLLFLQSEFRYLVTCTQDSASKPESIQTRKHTKQISYALMLTYAFEEKFLSVWLKNYNSDKLGYSDFHV